MFIHDVVGAARATTGDGRAKAEYERLGVRFFATYAGAAAARARSDCSTTTPRARSRAARVDLGALAADARAAARAAPSSTPTCASSARIGPIPTSSPSRALCDQGDFCYLGRAHHRDAHGTGRGLLRAA